MKRNERIDGVRSLISATSQRLLISLYCLLASVTIVAAFGRVPFPIGVVYALAIGLFAFPAVIGVKTDQLGVAAGLTVVATAITALVVIDPVLPGLFGSDSYSSLTDARALADYTSLLAYSIDRGDRPLIFAFALVGATVTGVPLAEAAKYLPLALVVLMPILYYVALERYVPRRAAVIATIGVASMRPLTMFETRFVPESIALTLFFLLLALVAIGSTDRGSRRRYAGLLVVVSVGIAVGHHLTSFMALGLFVIVAASATVARFQRSARFLPDSSVSSAARPLALVPASLLSITIAGYFVFFAPNQTASLLARALRVLFASLYIPVSAASDSGGSGAQTIRTILSGPAVYAIVGVFCTVVAVSVLSERRQPAWVAAWSLYAGLVAILFGAFVVAGRIVFLAPIRLLTFLIPFLLGVAAYACSVQFDARRPATDGGYHSSLSIAMGRIRPMTVFSVLVVCLLITQIATIHPWILVTIPGEGTLLEGHQTQASLEGATWANAYTEGEIVGFDASLWEGVAGREFVPLGEEGPVESACSEGLILAWRAPSSVPEPALTGTRDSFYSNGAITLAEC